MKRYLVVLLGLILLEGWPSARFPAPHPITMMGIKKAGVVVTNQ